MTPIYRNNSILITGASGMVGSAILRQVKSQQSLQLLAPNRNELDLCDRQQVDAYFEQYRPDYVLMIGAKVGEIIIDKTDPVGF